MHTVVLTLTGRFFFAGVSVDVAVVELFLPQSRFQFKLRIFFPPHAATHSHQHDAKNFQPFSQKKSNTSLAVFYLL